MDRIFTLFKGGVAALGGCIVFMLGGLDELLCALIALILLDYLSGLMGAVHNKALSSEIGFKGIAKKALCLLVVSMAYIIGRVTSAALPLREIVIMFFVVNEALSILENAARAGIPIPDKLKSLLAQLKPPA